MYYRSITLYLNVGDGQIGEVGGAVFPLVRLGGRVTMRRGRRTNGGVSSDGTEPQENNRSKIHSQRIRL